MRRILSLACLLAIICAAARPAAAAFDTGCCACLVQDDWAQTSQPPPPPPEMEALACRFITGTGYPDFVQLCENLGGNSAPCLEPTPGATCDATLAEAGIGCPPSPGVPAATAWGLGALALLLTALGVRAARHRAG